MNVGAISASMGKSVSESEQTLRNQMATMNPGDPMDQLRLQVAMGAHSTLVNLNSTVLKAIHETLNAIIRNIA